MIVLVATAWESGLGVTDSTRGRLAAGRSERRRRVSLAAGSLQFSPDGRWLVAAEGYQVEVLERGDVAAATAARAEPEERPVRLQRQLQPRRYAAGDQPGRDRRSALDRPNHQ